MEEGSGYAGGYGDQFPLASEDFDLAGAGEFGKVDGASAADAGGGGLIGGDGRKFGQELAGVDEEGVDFSVDRDSRFLRSASLSLRESEAPVGMTIRGWVGMTILYLSFDFFKGVGLGDFEFGYGGAAQRFEMGSRAEKLAHFVGYGTHVSSRGHAGAELGAVALDGEDDEFLNLDLHRLQDNLFVFSGQFVGRDAVDFLGRVRWRDLLD
jgi:hypothetical protein